MAKCAIIAYILTRKDPPLTFLMLTIYLFIIARKWVPAPPLLRNSPLDQASPPLLKLIFPFPSFYSTRVLSYFRLFPVFIKWRWQKKNNKPYNWEDVCWGPEFKVSANDKPVLMISKFNADVKISQESIIIFTGCHRFISNHLFFPKIR